jgi:anti-anti-sigma regulatory factor
MSTSFLGKLTALRTRVVDAGGRLALCRVNPVVQEILTLCRFDRLAPIYPSEHDALESF